MHFRIAALLCLSLIAPLFAQDTTPFPKPPSIKGLQVQMNDDALALGIHHAGININIAGLVDLEKKPENPKRVVDGFEFSFHESYFRHLDSQIKPLSDQGVLVYLIVLAYPSKNAAVDALVVHPDARKDHQYTVGGFNSVTPEGRAWLKAVTLEMASRWSGARPDCGRVWGWIVGNEVNSHLIWSNMGKKTLPEAVDNYAQAFRNELHREAMQVKIARMRHAANLVAQNADTLPAGYADQFLKDMSSKLNCLTQFAVGPKWDANGPGKLPVPASRKAAAQAD